MITLSKSKLLKFAELSELQIDGRSEFAYTNRLEHFAELVLSDLDVCMEHVTENGEPHQQLAAEQLNNKLLREALQAYIDEHEECQDAEDWMAMMCSMEAHHAADEALSQPSDTSAIDSFVAEKVKESHKVKTLTAQVAALELEVVRLREALSYFVQFNSSEQTIEVFLDTCEITKARKALSTPFTPTALPELIEKVEKMTIERCAGACKTLDRKEKRHAAGYGIGYLTYTASDCEQIIRALPTGQIKLEELP